MLTPTHVGSRAIGSPARPTYDDELLNAHYIAGDGRVNENIGLTAVHSIFHSEHNRLVDQTMDTILADRNDLAFLNQWLLRRHASRPSPRHRRRSTRCSGTASGCSRPASSAPRCNTSISCSRSSPAPSSRRSTRSSRRLGVRYVDLDPAIVAEFAHTVYRFGHSMLTETVDRFDPNFNVVGDSNPTRPAISRWA